ncbi:hypothetical protein [Spirillospora albida]|uniref:hypothetical protein n=1 Tax=Spirillospora albida TaxID=58123 RepID=UPI00146FF150|nr:hypothetical protein [Spirillospora albida]
MFLRRCAFITFWLVLGLYVLRHPESAAHTVHAITTGLSTMAEALSRFTSAF